MTPPSILSVGQCGFDHTRIAHHFEQTYGAQVHRASTFDEALDALRTERYDLVLVNRVNDEDGAPGIDLIRTVKGEAALAGVPVMLVSNFPEAQQEAEAAGALPGFGKSELTLPSTRTKLEAIFASRLPSGPGGQGKIRR